MAPRLFTCQVTQCLCCSLRMGVIIMSVLALTNASLAFAGEAALFSGMASSVAEKAAGTYLPAGTKLPSDPAAQGGLIFLGLYSLATFVFGIVAAVKRRVWAATAFWVMMMMDTFLGIAIAVILWLAGGSFNSLLAQVPIFVLNVYMVLVARSYRASCQAWAAGQEAEPAPGLPSGGVEGAGTGAGSGSAKAPAAVYGDRGPAGGVLVDEEDGDEGSDLAAGGARPPAQRA